MLLKDKQITIPLNWNLRNWKKVYQVVVPKKLEKGEYGFVNLSMMNPGGKVVVYAFGVD